MRTAAAISACCISTTAVLKDAARTLSDRQRLRFYLLMLEGHRLRTVFPRWPLLFLVGTCMPRRGIFSTADYQERLTGWNVL